MGRELKFRQWVKGKFYYWGIGIEGNTFVGPASGGGVRIDISPHQQFTGLKDRNGVDVYEGDVVDIKRRDDPNIYQVVVKDIRFLPEDFFGSGFEWSEVVGNIFANPELLERP